MFWTCAEHWGKDGGTFTLDRYWESSDWGKFDETHPRGRCPISHSHLGKAGLQQWLMIAKEYCQKGITDPTDKLPAVSSVAQYFASFWNDEYLAGLWRSYLIPSLLWRTGEVGNSRPSAWRAPSWSFLSLDGAIDFEHILYEDEDELKRPGYEVKTVRFDCTLISASVEPLSRAAPFGSILSASLTLEAHLIQLIPEAGCFDYEFPIRIGGGYSFDTIEEESDPDGKRTISRVNTNYGPLEDGEPLWGLLLHGHADERGSYKHFHGLLLARRPTGEYHRVGGIIFGHLHDALEQDLVDYFRDRAPTIITIV